MTAPAPNPTPRVRLRPVALGAAVLSALLLAPPSALAQPSEPASGAASTPDVPPEQTSPRAVLQAFVERMERDDKRAAAELLDLSGLPADAVAAKGPELAFLMLQVMQRSAEIPSSKAVAPEDWAVAFEDVPVETENNQPWSLAELGGETTAEAREIKIARSSGGRWRFSAETVKLIEELYEETENQTKLSTTDADAQPSEPFAVWYRNLFPAFLRERRLVLPTYQWLSLLLMVLVGRLADTTTRRSLTAVVDWLLHRYDPDFTESTASVWKPVGRLANAATWYGTAYAIGFPLRFVGLLLIVLNVVTVFSAILAAFAVIKLITGYMTRRAKRTQHKFDDLVIPVAASTARILVVVAGVIVVTAAFSEELPATLLGGLGIGGVAIALASQETLSNFFGSVTVLFDRPFEVGDWVIVDGIEGEIESVGFRSTRIRTGLNSQVTLPNNKLATAAIDNLGRRKYRRYLTRLGVEYGTTPDQMEAFCEGIRELIRRQPHTRKDFYAAYFNDFGASALEVLLVVYFEAPNWPTELRERHRLLADILRLAERLGVGFAFPTQTVHLHRGGAPPAIEPMPEPDRTGQTAAADIAGELLNYQDRPGKVKFPGPTDVNPTRPLA
ncbi:MAG: mechanosensitive ion channel family protein [Planctomycetota bacterium]